MNGIVIFFLVMDILYYNSIIYFFVKLLFILVYIGLDYDVYVIIKFI